MALSWQVNRVVPSSYAVGERGSYEMFPLSLRVSGEQAWELRFAGPQHYEPLGFGTYNEMRAAAEAHEEEAS